MKIHILTIWLLVFILITACKRSAEIENPDSCFTTDQSMYLIHDVIQFSNCSENAIKYEWNFGDGNYSTIRSPSKSYDETGEYDITLTTYSSDNKISEISKTIITKRIKIDTIEVLNTISNNHEFFLQLQTTNTTYGDFNKSILDNSNRVVFTFGNQNTDIDKYFKIRYQERESFLFPYLINITFNINLIKSIGNLDDGNFTVKDEASGFEFKIFYQLVD